MTDGQIAGGAANEVGMPARTREAGPDLPETVLVTSGNPAAGTPLIAP